MADNTESISDSETLTRKLPGGAKVVAKGTPKITAKRPKTGSATATAATPNAAASSSTVEASSSGMALANSGDVSLKTLELDTMGQDWYEALKGEFDKKYFKDLKSFLAAECKAHTVFPALKDVYSWSRLTALQDVKVVVIGQDPYHDDGQAHGLSFSVLPPTKTPPSLKNIYKQIAEDIPGFVIPKTGDLSPLAKLGVLWLNTSLTVRAHKAGSHAKKGWETFTFAVLNAVTSRPDGRGVVFFAWGAPAQKTCAGIDEDKHLVLKSAHPSPLSARKGFFGSRHFRLANEWLVQKYGEGEEIDWAALK